MLNKLMKRLVDLIYGTGRTRKKYELINPGENVLAADACKGIITKQDKDIVRGTDWISAQRAVVMLTNKNIVCGQWIIPIEDIESSQLLGFKSRLNEGAVLKIETKDGRHFQFGMQVNPEWTDQKSLPLKLEQTKLKHSVYSVIVRIITIGVLLYWLYNRFFAE